MAGIKIGNLPIDKAYFGNLPIDKIFYGNVEVYSSMPQLATPTISLSEDILSIEEVENAEYYDIYVDGVLEESVPAVSGFEVTLYGDNGDNETVYVQINDDPTWYYATIAPPLSNTPGFFGAGTNIPNVIDNGNGSITIPNVVKIKIGTEGNPTSYTGPKYDSSASTGNFVNLTFSSTGSTDPAYATNEITMTQDSLIMFWGDD